MSATLTTLVSSNYGRVEGSLLVDSRGDLFGTTVGGGVFGLGTVFELVKTSTGYASTPTVLASFDGVDGGVSEGSLLADAEGDLFGTTSAGPGNISGSVFEIAKTSAGYDSTPGTLINFIGANGLRPEAGLVADASGNLFGTTPATTSAGPSGGDDNGTGFEITKTGQFSTLVTFNGVDVGSSAGLIVDASGDLFGTTESGGANNGGTAFEIVKTPTGYASTPSTLVSFPEDFGASGLIADAHGDLFGTSGNLVFEIVKTATGYASTPTTLASFPVDVVAPVGGLVMDANGDLFGTTRGFLLNQGAVFEIKKTASGYANTPTTVVNFNSLELPAGGLIADSSGNLFGATGDRVFEVTGSGFVPGGPAKPPPSVGVLFPPNRLTTLVSFNSEDSGPGGHGWNPRGDLIADSNGDLFGTTEAGGSGTAANPAEGTVFEIAKTRHRLRQHPHYAGYLQPDDPDGPGGPVAGLLADANGDLFGTTAFGGANGDGTVFEIEKTAGGYASTPTTLVSFNGPPTALSPKGSLIADANGDLFGTTDRWRGRRGWP